MLKKFLFNRINFKILNRYISTNSSNEKSLKRLFQDDSFISFSESGESLAIVSLSNDIYVNLALENYIAEAINLKKPRPNVMLLWLSEPCIVFGRHQNPWLECNTKLSKLNNIKLARRYSGGGCVYHDMGNLNISFICDRLKYDRKFNLNLIKSTLELFNLDDKAQLNVSPRHDIFLDLKNDNLSYKVSGSASRLAKNFSYHHCTLLFDANMANMKLLRSNLIDKIITKATPSVRSKVVNLKEYFKYDTLNMNLIIEKLCQQYWKHNSTNWSLNHLFSFVNPENPEILKLLKSDLNELKSWDYIFGHTPKFKLNVKLINYELALNLENGLIKDYELKKTTTSTPDDASMKKNLDFFIGSKLSQSELCSKFHQHNLIDLDIDLTEFFNFINNNL